MLIDETDPGARTVPRQINNYQEVDRFAKETEKRLRDEIVSKTDTIVQLKDEIDTLLAENKELTADNNRLTKLCFRCLEHILNNKSE